MTLLLGSSKSWDHEAKTQETVSTIPSNRTLLRTKLAWESTLWRAFTDVTRRANPRSAGPDRVTVEEFRRYARRELKRLGDDLRTRRYVHSRGRAVPIPKNRAVKLTKDNVRPITVFNVRDRIVQRAIANIIWIHLRNHVYSKVSFGGIRSYRVRRTQEKRSTDAKKNVEAAARRILELRAAGHTHTFETDIRSFFPSLDKDRLLDKLKSALPDDTILDLLSAAISTEIDNPEEIERRGLSECWDVDRGVPQGGVLSPLLANFYLGDFGRSMTQDGFKMVRYVDDLVVLT